MAKHQYEGDEWKNADNGGPATRTREAEQAHINTEYANGRMELSEWRKRTDELSEPTKWVTSGKIK